MMMNNFLKTEDIIFWDMVEKIILEEIEKETFVSYECKGTLFRDIYCYCIPYNEVLPDNKISDYRIVGVGRSFSGFTKNPPTITIMFGEKEYKFIFFYLLHTCQDKIIDKYINLVPYTNIMVKKWRRWAKSKGCELRWDHCEY